MLMLSEGTCTGKAESQSYVAQQQQQIADTVAGRLGRVLRTTMILVPIMPRNDLLGAC